jgi:itaconate CoA-transferase
LSSTDGAPAVGSSLAGDRAEDASSERPLAGITVVSLEQAVAAPFATRQLADLGARVIKIERPGEGDFARGYDASVGGLASYFVWLNRTKESLALDVKSTAGRRVIEELLARADVFVANLSADALERLGLDGAAVAHRHPHLVTCYVSGYPSDHPDRSRRAYDLLVQAETGTAAVTGTATEPVKVGISIADIAAGMYAFSGILTALFVRERTGRSERVEVSLYEALTEWMSQPLYVAAGAGRNPLRRGLFHASIAPYGPVTTADGAVTILAIQSPIEWRRLCDQVLGRPELADDERFATNVARTENRFVLEGEIDEVAGALSVDEFTARLEAADIPHAALRDPIEALEALRRHLGPLPVVGTSVGPIEVFARAFRLSNTSRALGPVPVVGEHTERILTELGYDAAAVREMGAGAAS